LIFEINFSASMIHTSSFTTCCKLVCIYLLWCFFNLRESFSDNSISINSWKKEIKMKQNWELWMYFYFWCIFLF